MSDACLLVYPADELLSDPDEEALADFYRSWIYTPSWIVLLGDSICRANIEVDGAWFSNINVSDSTICTFFIL